MRFSLPSPPSTTPSQMLASGSIPTTTNSRSKSQPMVRFRPKMPSLLLLKSSRNRFLSSSISMKKPSTFPKSRKSPKSIPTNASISQSATSSFRFVPPTASKTPISAISANSFRKPSPICSRRKTLVARACEKSKIFSSAWDLPSECRSINGNLPSDL